MAQINVRVYGSKQDIEAFLHDLRKFYGTVLNSPILMNKRPDDIFSHRVIITVDVGGTSRE